MSVTGSRRSMSGMDYKIMPLQEPVPLLEPYPVTESHPEPTLFGHGFYKNL